MSAKEMPTVARVLIEEGGHWSDTIMWAKDRFTLGRADYRRGYGPVWYGWREGSTHHWCGDRDQNDVWTIARPSESPLHSTMKPVPLMERTIENSSPPGALILDPFAGSGSTLIAAERTGRVCAAVEIDPATATSSWRAGKHSQATVEVSRDTRSKPTTKSQRSHEL
jgi:DNA modification methylase